MDNTTTKPSYDARNEYYDVLKMIMLVTKQQSIMGNHAAWYRGLQEMLNMVIAYIDNEKAMEIEKELKAAGKAVQEQLVYSQSREPKLRALGLVRGRELEEQLLSISKKIHLASKDMMLPSSKGDGDVLDDDAFLRDSDL